MLCGSRCGKSKRIAVFYCDKLIRGVADVDHFIPWSRHPDNGLENLVIADQRCNSDKRDFLAAADHVLRWREEHFHRRAADLAQISAHTGWERHPERTFAVARSIYLRLPATVSLWLKGREFTAASRRVLEDALATSEARV